jgi:hypothetical protein
MTQHDPPLPHETVRQHAGSVVHRLVLTEAEEAEKFRRRLHLHLLMLSAIGLLTFLSLIDALNAACLISSTLGINTLQEALDYAGRF